MVNMLRRRRTRPNEFAGTLCGGSGLGIKHQGHVRKPGKKLGSVWETMLECLPGMKKPANFQGGQTDGVFKEVL